MFAMMSNAISTIEAVGLQEPIHHCFHTFRAMHFDRLSIGIGDPALQHQLAQTIDVI